MKNASLFFIAMTLMFMFTSCAEDSLTEAVNPAASSALPDVQEASAACKTLDLLQEMSMEFEVTEAKGPTISLVQPGGLRITGVENTNDLTLGAVSTSVDIIYQFFTNDARGTALIIEQTANDYLELRLAGRQAAIGKNTIQVSIIGVRGSGEYRQYNRASGTLTIEFEDTLDEIMGIVPGVMTIEGTLDCESGDISDTP